jgi:hypothetical protein
VDRGNYNVHVNQIHERLALFDCYIVTLTFSAELIYTYLFVIHKCTFFSFRPGASSCSSVIDVSSLVHLAFILIPWIQVLRLSPQPFTQLLLNLQLLQGFRHLLSLLRR